MTRVFFSSADLIVCFSLPGPALSCPMFPTAQSGATALILANEEGHAECVRLMLAAGTAVNATTKVCAVQLLVMLLRRRRVVLIELLHSEVQLHPAPRLEISFILYLLYFIVLVCMSRKSMWV
jgi:hypothetical protein